MAYIYQITNDVNGKIYIGKTEFSIERRFAQHCQEHKRDRCKNRPLYRAMNKYGVEHFHIQTLEETDMPEEREEFWIKQKNSYHNGYNATLGGDGKKYIDYNAVAQQYKKVKNKQLTADLLDISVDSVREILKQMGVANIKVNTGMCVDMYDLQDNYLTSFDSMHRAAVYLIENKITACKRSTIATHISECCRNIRKTAFGFKWKISES